MNMYGARTFRTRSCCVLKFNIVVIRYFQHLSSQFSPILDMSSINFTIPGLKHPVPVTIGSSASSSTSSSTAILTEQHLRSFPAFKTWLLTLQHSLSLQYSNMHHPFHNEPYLLRGIEIQAADYFGGGKKLGFVKLKADITNANGERLPGSVFLRGGSVGMLVWI